MPVHAVVEWHGVWSAHTIGGRTVCLLGEGMSSGSCTLLVLSGGLWNGTRFHVELSSRKQALSYL